MGFSKDVIINSRREFLDGVNLKDKVVLDAGTGGWSARFLAQQKPKKIVCISGPGDARKFEEARNALQSIGYKNYQLLSGNLIDPHLFPENAFDFIFADYLMEEIDFFAPLSVCTVLRNLYKFLRCGGDFVIINPEAHVPFRPESELISTLEIRGDAQLGKRSPRDLIDALHLLLSTAVTLKSLSSSTFFAHYPSDWIGNWLTDAGFGGSKRYFFDLRVPLIEEFKKRVTFTRQIISTMSTAKLREGLLEQVDEVAEEYNRRNVTADDFYLQRHYIICAKKMQADSLNQPRNKIT